jgi:DNA-binding HxlR family transcriptional regulator
MPRFGPPTKKQIEKMRAIFARHTSDVYPELDPRVEILVQELIGRVADRWTMVILEALLERGTLRFTQLGRMVTGISQKMLTQTVRQMERDGLLTRKVYPVVPPRVEYALTDLGLTLSAAFCGVWVWAAENLSKVEAARNAFDKRAKDACPKAALSPGKARSGRAGSAAT